MKRKKGGIKTNIVLFSVLVVVSLLLFLFVFTIFSDNKLEITKKLKNFNECSDIKYNIINSEYKNNTLIINIKNDRSSKKIEKINLIYNGKTIEKPSEINLGEIKKIQIQNITFNDIGIYMNDCDAYIKKIDMN